VSSAAFAVGCFLQQGQGSARGFQARRQHKQTVSVLHRAVRVDRMMPLVDGRGAVSRPAFSNVLNCRLMQAPSLRASVSCKHLRKVSDGHDTVTGMKKSPSCSVRFQHAGEAGRQALELASDVERMLMVQ